MTYSENEYECSKMRTTFATPSNSMRVSVEVTLGLNNYLGSCES